MFPTRLPRIVLFAGTVFAFIAVACVPALAQPRPAPPAARKYPLPLEPRVYDTYEQKIRVSVVAHGIGRPWSLLPLPDGTFLVGVRPTGQVLAIRDGVLDPAPLSGLPAMHTTRTTGMLDMAMHPKFAENKWIYFTYSKPLDGNTFTLALARARFTGKGFSDVEELYAGNAANTWGSRLAFGLDGKVYITVGGAGRLPDAQATNTIFGKVLRLNDDGTTPKDNPFVGKAGSRPEIYTIGHRDHHGIAVNPSTGQIFQAELGPMGGDKINILKAGGNYGWPTNGYGRDNDGSPMPLPGPDMEQAWITWNPGITPSGLLFYTGDQFPKWKGNIFVGSIQKGRIASTGGLERIVFNDKLWEQRRESLLQDFHQRVRDVRQGPDGLIYLLTEEDDGAVLRIEPVK
ncbi:MAG TPA: PQQ-dependent sugar dehydrogenase [Bryobacteraceae bacterium]|jgi:glucose/arabinose dehydrogenase|nr:PQQ-dependent sugar dehydrogenase [Bryobacteraceae bacterium]